MAATIHPLFTEPAKTESSRDPLISELQEITLQQLGETVRRMFESADDTLFEMGEKAPNDSERRRYFDTMRVLRIDRSTVSQAFAAQLAKGFAASASKSQVAGAFDLDSLSIQPTEELEERIALGNLAAKLEGICKNLIWDLERRLELAQARGVAIDPRALSPARICEAFGAATSVLETDFQVKLVIFKLFDRALSRDLEPLYQSAGALLDRKGFDPRPQVSGLPLSSRREGPGLRPRDGAASPLDSLRAYGVEPEALHIGNDASAASLREILQTLLAREGHGGSFEASAQRLSVAGQMFDQLLSEPTLNDSLRSAFEPLRYPLYRTALVDREFFTSAAHPIRKMLGNLFEVAAATQTGEVSVERFRALLQTLIAQLDGDASTSPDSGATTPGAQLLTGAEYDGFISELREQSRDRRSALLLHVRQMIAQELELRTIGRDVPKAAQTLLRSGIGPLMAVRLLRNGRSSAAFRESQELLERVLSTLEGEAPLSNAEFQGRQELLEVIRQALREIGMTDERAEALIGGLAELYEVIGRSPEPTPAAPPMAEDGPETGRETVNEAVAVPAESAPVAPAASGEPERSVVQEPLPPLGSVDADAPLDDAGLPRITPFELLSRVLTPESWFRVFDASQNQTRWLKLGSFYANQDSVTFTGFDESTRLSLRASRLVEDLVSGCSEPINPTAQASEALDQLRQARAHGLL